MADTPPPEWYDPPCDPEWSANCDDVLAACAKLDTLSEGVSHVDAAAFSDTKKVSVELMVDIWPREYNGLAVLDQAERIFRRLAMECRSLYQQHVKEMYAAKGVANARNQQTEKRNDSTGSEDRSHGG